MAYSGRSYLIDCSTGGLTGNDNVDVVGANMMIYPTRNINLHNGGREKRGGTSHVNTVAVTGTTPKCLGGFDFIKYAGTQARVTAWSTGKLYADDTTEIGTGLGTTDYYNFCQAEDKLFICDSVNTPKAWTGSGSAAEIAHPAADFTTYPVKQMVVHGTGNAERLWALNQMGVYASKVGDFEDFADSTVVNIPIDTGDGFGLVGMVEFGERLIVFGKRKAYIIDDTDTDTANWGYSTAIWDGGAAHWRLITRTPNDIVCMMEDGEIYSVVTAEQYGDYKYGSLVRPAWIHRYLKLYTRLTYVTDFHAIYDPTIRAIKIFYVRLGQTTIGGALVYFIDRGAEGGWSVHDNQTADSGYSAASSWICRKSSGDWKVYTGDYEGFIWELETSNYNDNSAAYYAGFKTPSMPFDNGKTVLSRVNKAYNGLTTMVIPRGEYDLSYNWWLDGVQQTGGSVSMGGAGTLLGSFVLNTDSLGSLNIVDKSSRLGGVGQRVQFEFYNSGVDQTFFVSQIMIDFKIKGYLQQ
jgi:hypothetical protein